MGRPANYSVVETTPDRVVIRDLGPWNKHFTITNDAEGVVERVIESGILNGRRLFYFDSEGDLDELVIKDDKFVGFAAGHTTRGGSA